MSKILTSSARRCFYLSLPDEDAKHSAVHQSVAASTRIGLSLASPVLGAAVSARLWPLRLEKELYVMDAEPAGFWETFRLAATKQ